MTVYVFAGPTLSHDEIGKQLDAVCLPPAAQGDIYRAALGRPRVIAVVDGYFEGVPAIWHKEVLWALDRGIHVFGSASMGALRAAELADFGMTGVGEIFEGYRAGALQDDDEVAVLHGPAETGYVALTEAMVNIRATLGRARDEAIIAPGSCDTLERLAKQTFYQERSWDSLLDHPTAAEVPAPERDALRAWLPAGRVDLKQADARAMLSAIGAFLAADPPPKETTFTFEWTDMWDKATVFSPATGLDPKEAAGALERSRVLDELRLEGEGFQRVRQQALLRLLALRESDRQRVQTHENSLKQRITKFRRDRQLFRRADLERWLAANDVQGDAFEHLMESEARLAAVESLFEESLDPHLYNSLRLNGHYSRLAERARRKDRTLAALGLEDPEPGRVGPKPAELLAWFFEGRLRRGIPDDIDGFARAVGCAGRRDFYHLLLREFLYSFSKGEGSEAEKPKSEA